MKYFCANCGKEANKSRRAVGDWKGLCVSCYRAARTRKVEALKSSQTQLPSYYQPIEGEIRTAYELKKQKGSKNWLKYIWSICPIC